MDDYNLCRQFKVAKKIREKSNHRKKMSAVIIKHGKIISTGFNIQKTHPQYADGKSSYSIHAEVSTILKSCTDLSGSTIYIYREINGVPALAKPCNNCLKMVIEAGIKKIVYSVGYYPYFIEVNL
jgi:dCMP deaminase